MIDPNEITGWLSHCENVELLLAIRDHIVARIAEVAREKGQQLSEQTRQRANLPTARVPRSPKGK